MCEKWVSREFRGYAISLSASSNTFAVMFSGAVYFSLLTMSPCIPDQTLKGEQMVKSGYLRVAGSLWDDVIIVLPARYFINVFLMKNAETNVMKIQMESLKIPPKMFIVVCLCFFLQEKQLKEVLRGGLSGLPIGILQILEDLNRGGHFFQLLFVDGVGSLMFIVSVQS